MAASRINRLRVATLMLTCVGGTLAVMPARADAQASYGRAEGPTEALSRHMRVLATDQRNFQALIGAGKAALSLGDTQSAAGFFGRAEEVWPASPMPQAGMGAALAHEGNGAGALQYFARATQLGAAVQTFAVDRGLAFDLLGRHSDAQSDFRLAMATSDADEARRRLALSLAITGKSAEAIAILGPLMARGDAGGARSRALVLALSGDAAGARASLNAAMPGSAYQMDPFFRQLPALRSDQKAAAVHLGIFPDSGQSVAVANVAPPVDRLASIEQMLAAQNAPAATQPSRAAPPPAVAYTPPTTGQIAAGAASVANRATVGQQVSSKRHWVQLASGPNAGELPDQFRRFKRRYPELLEDLAGYVADEADRSRLLVGPFKDSNDASIFADDLASGGLNAFSWTAPQGKSIRKLSTE